MVPEVTAVRSPDDLSANWIDARTEAVVGHNKINFTVLNRRERCVLVVLENV